MAGEVGALGPLCRGEAPITRAKSGPVKGPNPTGPEPRQAHGDHLPSELSQGVNHELEFTIG